MAISIAERVTSRESTSGDTLGQTRMYVIDGTNSESVALDTLAAASPILVGLRKTAWTVTPIGDPLLSLKWDGEVTYANVDVPSNTPPESGQEFLNFDTGSSTVHITQSISTPQKAAISPATATDRKGAINSSKEGTEGVDIIAPELRWSATKYFDYDYVTTTYLATLADLAGTTNNAIFTNFAVGEVLFINAAGNRRGTNPDEDGWEITFNFAVQRNIPAGLVIAPGITFTSAINGWDYIWVSYQSKLDTTNNVRIESPVEAYVEQIYKPGDFTLLGLT